MYHDNEGPVPTRADRIVAYFRRQLDRLARVEVYGDDDNADFRHCLELRRPKSDSLPSEAHLLRTRPNTSAILDTRKSSYQCHLNEDCHPFITTPSSLGEGGPRLIGSIIPASSLQHAHTG